MKNYVIEMKTVNQLLTCVALCGNSPVCRSVNLCGQSCELNRIGIYDKRAESNVERDGRCVYKGMAKETAPVCLEDVREDILKDIEDDEDPGLCRINRKRLDSQWGDWVETEEDSSTVWRLTWTRECSSLAHEGVDFCDGRFYEEEVEEIWFYTLEKTVDEAESFCEEDGGYLWGDVDGTRSQLQWIFNKLGGFYLG